MRSAQPLPAPRRIIEVPGSPAHADCCLKEGFMLHRYSAALVAGLTAAMALGFVSGPAFAAEGQFSIGGNFGTGIYSNSDLNKLLKAATPPRKEVKSGWEYGGSLRYGVSSKLALDLEANSINGKATTTNPSGDGDEHWRTKGLAIPLNLYYALAQNDDYNFNFFAGAGPMVSSKLHASDNSTDIKSDNKTVFYGQAGFEGQFMLGQKVALGARALGRIAKVKDVKVGGVSSSPPLNLDLSGAAFGIGLRVFL
jgi:hypothetical protein